MREARLKYAEKYPRAKPSEEVEPKLFLAGSDRPCCMCGAPTSFIKTDLRDFICSEACSDLVASIGSQQVKEK